ncbi:hypothetical protein QU487_09080 [Crenobacter sp. SG2305]|uniref:protein YgfX n=1 Tax=Crenobacter oryzisoli TaxID=3056844 RepID=UPI0025AB4CC1|nr:protein YgfX [Crenobacter sp. SG2305]MDN0082907.1 hypothetical protein [Crenobacter sp. SG2305]
MAATLTPFSANLHRSRRWLTLVLSMHGALAVVLLAYLPAWWGLLLAVPLTLWLALAPEGWLPGQHRVVRLTVDPRGRLLVAFERSPWLNGAESPAELLDDSFISTWLIVLNLRVEGRRHSVMVWPDSVSAEFHRALRVYSLWFQAADKSAPVVEI